MLRWAPLPPPLYEMVPLLGVEGVVARVPFPATRLGQFLGNGVLPRAIAAYLAGSGLLADARAHRHVWPGSLHSQPP